MIKNENGRSMIEMLGVLAIIGVLSVGGIAGYSKAMYRFKMNKTIDIFNRVLIDFAEFTSHRLDDGELDMFEWGDDEEHGLADYLDSLKDICTDREYEDFNGEKGYSCPLPIGEIWAAIETYDHIEYGTMGNFYGEFAIQFDGENQKQACVDFASYDWVHVVPQEWLIPNNDTSGGGIYIVAGDNWEHIYHPAEGKNSYTLSEIADACGKCEQGERCMFYIHFYGEV